MNDKQTQPRLLKTKQAAQYIGCSEWKLRTLVHDGRIPFIPLDEEGKVWRLDIHDLDRFIETRRQVNT